MAEFEVAASCSNNAVRSIGRATIDTSGIARITPFRIHFFRGTSPADLNSPPPSLSFSLFHTHNLSPCSSSPRPLHAVVVSIPRRVSIIPLSISPCPPLAVSLSSPRARGRASLRSYSSPYRSAYRLAYGVCAPERTLYRKWKGAGSWHRSCLARRRVCCAPRCVCPSTTCPCRSWLEPTQTPLSQYRRYPPLLSPGVSIARAFQIKYAKLISARVSPTRWWEKVFKKSRNYERKLRAIFYWTSTHSHIYPRLKKKK